MTQEGQSATSAKPAPRPRELIARDLRGLLTPLTRPFDQIDEYTLNQLLSELEASPAAERTALEAIQGKIEDRLQAISMPKGSSTEDTLRWVLSLFDAQGRAGAKAEICNAWHGNDFSQCQLPKGHEGNHLCVMRWEWQTASKAASEQGGTTK